MVDVLAVIFLFGGGTLFLLSLSPVGRAFAERLKAKGRIPDADLVADVDALRREVAELQDRVDFTERLLTQHHEPDRIPREH